MCAGTGRSAEPSAGASWGHPGGAFPLCFEGFMGRQGLCEQSCSNGAQYTRLVLVASYNNKEILKINVI